MQSLYLAVMLDMQFLVYVCLMFLGQYSPSIDVRSHSILTYSHSILVMGILWSFI